MGNGTERIVTADIVARRPPELRASPPSRAEQHDISSARLVDALLLGGFEVFRVDGQGTILERSGRAVVIPHGGKLRRDVVDDLRKIAGVGLSELEKLLASR